MYYGSDYRQQRQKPPESASPMQKSGHKNPAKQPCEKAPKENENKRYNLTQKPNFKDSFSSQKNSSILNLLNFKGLKLDNDRLIIIAICLLLSGEDIDELLMLALIYIML